MTTYAEARARLLEIADEIRSRYPRQARELREIEERIKRRSPVRRATDRSDFVTSLVRARVKDLACAHPDMSYKEIANRTGVNQGRVSEIIAGKRE